MFCKMFQVPQTSPEKPEALKSRTCTKLHLQVSQLFQKAGCIPCPEQFWARRAVVENHLFELLPVSKSTRVVSAEFQACRQFHRQNGFQHLCTLDVLNRALHYVTVQNNEVRELARHSSEPFKLSANCVYALQVVNDLRASCLLRLCSSSAPDSQSARRGTEE